VLLSNFNWQSNTLGGYYQLDTSPLKDAGSRSAAEAGLYHFTTSTSQAKEGASQVDIGLHWVAINTSSGLSVDTDGDGIPDFLEDANGNGLVEAAECSMLLVDTDGDGLTDMEEVAFGFDPTSSGSPGTANQRNYIYDRLNRLRQVFGNHTVTITPDKEGNILH
jgi:hypothetical protein